MTAINTVLGGLLETCRDNGDYRDHWDLNCTGVQGGLLSGICTHHVYPFMNSKNLSSKNDSTKTASKLH